MADPFAGIDLAPVMTDFIGHVGDLISNALPVIIPLALVLAGPRILRRIINAFV